MDIGHPNVTLTIVPWCQVLILFKNNKMSHPIQIFLTCAPSNLMSTVLIPQPDILEQTSYRNLTTSFCRLLFSIFSRSARSRSVSCSFERRLASFSSSSLLLLLDTTMLAHIADIQKRSSFLKSTGTMTVSYSFSKLRKMFWPLLSSPELRQSYKEINPVGPGANPIKLFTL